MKYKILILSFLIVFSALLPHGRNIAVINVTGEGETPRFAESISVTVNCTTAELTVFSTVYSVDSSLVHFPPDVNLDRSELINAVLVSIGFSRLGSGLVIAFNNTDAATARALADVIKDSMENAFNTNFTWNSTEIEDGYVYVKYTGPGKSDLTGYLSWLMGKCLAPDLGGFTLTFLPMSGEEMAIIEVSASKESGGFNWINFMTVGYLTEISVGMGPHRIDILDLLNVESLAPSKYSSYEGWFSSSVQFIVLSHETVSYLSSEPGLVNPPTQIRGWLINPSPPKPPAQLTAQFIFANDPEQISKLSITFSGLIIPEYTAAAYLIPIALATFIMLLTKKWLRSQRRI